MSFRQMQWKVIFGFWIAIWVSYIAINLIAHYFLTPFLGGSISHVFRNLIIIPVYCFFAYHYRGIALMSGYRSYCWRTGLIWVVFSMIASILYWNLFFSYSISALLDEFNILNGRLWGVQFIGLLIAPNVAKKYARYQQKYRHRNTNLRKFIDRKIDNIFEYISNKREAFLMWKDTNFLKWFF